MKEEVRRENDLESWLVSHSSVIKAYWKPVVIIAALILLVFIIWASVKSAQINKQKRLWAEYDRIVSAEGKTPEEMREDLDAFAKANLNTLPGSQAAFVNAARFQFEGFQQLGANKLTAAKESLEKSKKLFSDLVSAKVNDEMDQMAKFALAKNAELMAQIENTEENIKTAKSLYAEVAQSQSIYGRRAQQILNVYKLDEANIIALSKPAPPQEDVSGDKKANESLEDPNLEMLPPSEENTNSAAEEVLTEDAKDAPAEEAKDAPAEEVKEAPAEEAKEAPAEEAKEAPAEEAKEAPAEEVKEAPAEEVKEAPAEEAKEAPAEEAKEASAEEVKDAPAEEAKEAPAAGTSQN